jgi:putative endonuclease
MKTYWTYIMSNKSHRLYVGFTSNLPYRVFPHQNKLYPDSFTARYEFYMLVWYEAFESVIREASGKKIPAGSLSLKRFSGSNGELPNPEPAAKPVPHRFGSPRPAFGIRDRR